MKKINYILQFILFLTGIASLFASNHEYNHSFHHIIKDQGLSSNQIRCIYQDKTGFMWFGTNDGLNRYDGISFEIFKKNTLDSCSLKDNTIISIVEEPGTENLFIGTQNYGLYYFNKDNYKFFRKFKNDGIVTLENYNSINFLTFDVDTNLWIGTNNGLFIYSHSSRKLEETPINSLPNKQNLKIKHVLFDADNAIISTDGGVVIINNNNNHFKTLFKNENINYTSMVTKTENNKFWISSNSGIYVAQLYPKPKILKTYINNINNFCFEETNSIIVNEKGNLFISANNHGLYYYEYLNDKFFPFLPDNTSPYSISSKNIITQYKSSSGIFWFGSSDNGIYYFDNNKKDNLILNKHLKHNNLIIIGFELFNKPVTIGENSPLKKHISRTKEIQLKHNQSSFSFEFIAINYTSPEKNKYAYMLEGFDTNWIDNNNKRKASYTNISSGTYIFRVKSSDSDGIWNENDISIKIVVLPPWWETWWFKILSLIFILLVIYFLYLLLFTSYLKELKKLRQLINQKTKELQKTKEQIYHYQKLLENELKELQSSKENLLTYEALIKVKNEELKTSKKSLFEQQKLIKENIEQVRLQKETLIPINKNLDDKIALIESQLLQLKETNEKLQGINSTKNNFFSIIGHDVRNPIGIIQGFTELLLKNYKTYNEEKLWKFLLTINNTAKSASALLENLLIWARSQSNQFFLAEKINLCILAIESISFFETEAKIKKISINQRIDPSIHVKADKMMINTVFRNLISNAIKFTSQNGKVDITAVIDDAFAEITISDNGIGISEDTQQKLFLINSNISTKGTENESGTGFGLIICKEFIEKNNGRIWVESEEGKGSKFKFKLPLS